MRENNKFLVVRSDKDVRHFEQSKVSHIYIDELDQDAHTVEIRDLETSETMSFIKLDNEDRFRLDHLVHKPNHSMVGSGADLLPIDSDDESDKKERYLVWSFVVDHDLNLFLADALENQNNSLDDGEDDGEDDFYDDEDDFDTNMEEFYNI